MLACSYADRREIMIWIIMEILRRRELPNVPRLVLATPKGIMINVGGAWYLSYLPTSDLDSVSFETISDFLQACWGGSVIGLSSSLLVKPAWTYACHYDIWDHHPRLRDTRTGFIKLTFG